MNYLLVEFAANRCSRLCQYSRRRKWHSCERYHHHQYRRRHDHDGNGIVTAVINIDNSKILQLTYIGHQVTAVPQIGAISISGDGNGLVLSGTGGVANANFYLLGTTSLSDPMTNWARLLTNHFDSSGNFNSTNTLDPNWPQGYYRLQLP
jgi:hypothetical protein